MTPSSNPRPAQRLLRWLQLGANHVLVLMMATMFVAFILQIGFRYISNKPLAWTDEVCMLMWLWGILWGASFVMSHRDDIRFDVLTSHAPRGVRRAFTVVVSAAIVAILLLSLPASWSYIRFMKVENSAALGIRMDWYFSMYLAFVVAMVVRHAWLGIEALRGRLYDDEPTNSPARDIA
jgi:TRAP-type C4-dicarboxylate transport system permease small subunit